MHCRYAYNGRVYEVMVEVHNHQVHAVIDGQEYDYELLEGLPGETLAQTLHLRAGDRPITLHWAITKSQVWVSHDGCSYLLKKPDPRRALAAGQSHAGQESLCSPMPAQVRAVEVSAGQAVAAGQTLLLLEAMKMEIRLQAPHAGRVLHILVGPGETVQRDQVLCVMRQEGLQELGPEEAS